MWQIKCVLKIRRLNLLFIQLTHMTLQLTNETVVYCFKILLFSNLHSVAYYLFIALSIALPKVPQFCFIGKITENRSVASRLVVDIKIVSQHWLLHESRDEIVLSSSTQFVSESNCKLYYISYYKFRFASNILHEYRPS